jgi:hypothetical protein
VDLTGLDDAFRAGNAAGRPPLYRLAVANPPGAQDGAVVNSAAKLGESESLHRCTTFYWSAAGC